MIKIAYDAGHGFNTAGKRTPDNEREWNFNDVVARAFAAELALYDGVTTKRFDDPTGKTDIALKTRTDGANSWSADYFISFHHNASTGKWGTWTGVETFTYTTPKIESIQLAMALHPAVVEAYGLRDRGIKKADLHIVRETKCPAILIEGGFMDSTIDIKKLRDKTVLGNAGKLVAQALARHLKLTKKQAPTQTNDYEKHWAAPSIKKAMDAGVMAGYGDGDFGPEDSLSRAQMATILDRLGLLK